LAGEDLVCNRKGAALNRFKVAVVAPNGSGKSERLVAIAALRWLYRFPKGKVIVTSADSRQLDLQVMPALRKHSGVFRRWEFLSRQVRTPENGFLNAFTTDESGRAEGHHSGPDTPLLIIADEAKSIPEPIFEAIDRCSFNVLLLISSPGLMQGRFYNCFTSHRAEWLTFQVGLTDCPHVSQERIDDVVNSYGPEHPFTRSTLHGEFMAEEEGTTFAVSLKALQDLLASPPAGRLSSRDRVAFCDFAAGGDENVLAIRSGNMLTDLITWRERDTMAGVGKFILEFRKAGLQVSQIWGDASGLGLPMCDALREAGWPINRFNFGAKAGDDMRYVNRSAEIWTNLGKMVARREAVLIRDEGLISQLTSRKTSLDSRGRLKLESKEDMRVRGLKSPDRADAVVAVFALGAGFANSSNRPAYRSPSEDPMGELSRYYDGQLSSEDDHEGQSEFSRAGLSDPGW
jgi:phage terminase large subunit